MTWYPGAIRMELQPESDNQPAIRPTQFIVHSIAAPWDEKRLYAYWRDSTNLESHFGLDYDGSLGQYIGTQTRADANYKANLRPDGSGAVSIETASDGDDPWTPEQIEELIKLGVWLHHTHGIPLHICQTADDPGYGYHRLHAAWAASGTDCPGDTRVQQFKKVVFPGIVARATGQTTDPSEEDDLPTAQEIADAVWAKELTNVATGRPVTPGAVMAWMDKVHATQNDITGRQIAAMQGAITALATQLGQHDDVDTDAVVAAVREAIAAAVIDVDVTVSGTPTPKES
ncbi:N-acetylmuramoyl-L-alanine amidase [Streptomyces sp. ISL-43]|uniref:peptidoglycan recognition protein family protein n=1 Tax=Streptomyces sp. ISL-43 TaxID=2819183 RepID=UPI001BEB10AA|nr:N-acetylmuramoyl-L-alanine amidase [Streptomyces sp. ISL-43]MBT2449487.1 N-acetylmuramoyl-L-alanine amidase [Streptomyces sp. ISL-43]